MRKLALLLFQKVRNYLELFFKKVHNKKMKIIKYNQILNSLIMNFIKLNNKEYFKNLKYLIYTIKLE